MQFDLDVEGWPEGDWDGFAQKAARALLKVSPELDNSRLLISLLLTNDDEVHALNREWRGRDKPTNVLSFPMVEREDLLELEADGEGAMPPVPLGDIAMAYETCAREAEAKGLLLEHHAAHLLIHGLLHLAGYDHVDSEEQAEAMEALEIRALANMGIADPYGDRN